VLRTSQRRRLTALLAALSSLTITGCIVQNTEYGAPRQSPVFVLDSSITPSTLTPLMVTVAPTNTVHLYFTVFAEDAGEELLSALYVDYKHDHGYYVSPHRHGVSTFATPRTVKYDIGSEHLPIGCHALTIMVFHESDWDDANYEIIGTPSDLASVTWFAGIEEDGSAIPLASCPNVSTETPITPR
jgi:hypothetical protein